MRMQNFGVAASFLLVVAFIVPAYIYLTGNLSDPIGPYAYALADILYGPVWGASLVAAVFALRERAGDRAPRRMSMALLAAVFAAGMMVLVASIRASNRQYHLAHPDLHLETSTTVLIVWATIVQGGIAAGWHFLGWVLVLLGSAGGAAQNIPRGLSLLYLAGGIVSLLVFVVHDLEPFAAGLGVAWSVWQGILFWKDAGRTGR